MKGAFGRLYNQIKLKEKQLSRCVLEMQQEGECVSRLAI
jgi:hypothetical protein